MAACFQILRSVRAVLPVMLSTMLLPEMEQEQGLLQEQLKQHQLAADPAAAQVMIGGVWVWVQWRHLMRQSICFVTQQNSSRCRASPADWLHQPATKLL